MKIRIRIKACRKSMASMKSRLFAVNGLDFMIC